MHILNHSTSQLRLGSFQVFHICMALLPVLKCMIDTQSIIYGTFQKPPCYKEQFFSTDFILSGTFYTWKGNSAFLLQESSQANNIISAKSNSSFCLLY